MNTKLNRVGLYVGAVFGTAAFTYLSSSLSLVAFQSIRGLMTKQVKNKPLAHLKSLNNQSKKFSIAYNLPTNVHSRCT
ncbi:hypothetical protein BY458DRAFT_497783 [Sporodiniella umbellata]|nr:hypothetical protein BY458DRAFT_497783 [Sporodiniella umbellata]